MSPMVSWPIARATLRRKVRSGSPWVMGAALALAGMLRASPSAAGTETFSGPAAIWFILLTLVLGAGLLSEELEAHAQLVLLRPITRASWYGGRLAGACLSLAVFCAVAWTVTFAASARRGGGPDPVRLGSLALAVLWGSAWMSVLAFLGTVLRSWTNAGALLAAIVGWWFVLGLSAALRPEWSPLLVAVTSYLGPQDPLVLVEPGRPGRDFGPAIYDLVWLFGPWLAGVSILNRRELARRTG